jgi:hypothetical protein
MTVTDTEPIRKPHRTISERFATFQADYPQVERMIIGFARQAKRRGFEHYGIDAIVNRARWEVAMTWGPDSEQGFKLNDHFSALYARKIMAENPDLDGFFFTRKRRAA